MCVIVKLWEPYAIKARSSHLKTSEEYRSKEKYKGEHDMEIVDVSVTRNVDAMSADDDTAVNVCVVHVNNYYQTDFFVSIEKNENRDILLRDLHLSHVTFLQASF